MLTTQIIVGVVKKLHLLLMNTKPKCEMCVNANVALSTIAAFFSPMHLSKLECTMPLKNSSSPMGLKIIPAKAKL